MHYIILQVTYHLYVNVSIVVSKIIIYCKSSSLAGRCETFTSCKPLYPFCKYMYMHGKILIYIISSVLSYFHNIIDTNCSYHSVGETGADWNKETLEQETENWQIFSCMFKIAKKLKNCLPIL